MTGSSQHRVARSTRSKNFVIPYEELKATQKHLTEQEKELAKGLVYQE